jgi:hypothetical protein
VYHVLIQIQGYVQACSICGKVCALHIHHHYNADVVASRMSADNSGVRGFCLDTVAALEANVA